MTHRVRHEPMPARGHRDQTQLLRFGQEHDLGGRLRPGVTSNRCVEPFGKYHAFRAVVAVSNPREPMDSRMVAISVRLSTVLAVFAFAPLRGGDGAPPASPSANVPTDWLTKAEQTEFRETPRYEETTGYARRLATASEWIEVQSFGRSPEGRALPLIIASKDRAFTADAARATGKFIVLVQCCIHAGECDGKDASLMLLRDIAVTKARADLLDHAILLVIPIFNVDGHERFGPYNRINQNGPAEMGWRTTAQNLNLNRDYMKADAPEMRAWLTLWNTWRPDLHFDHHVTDGGDWQYDVTFDADTHATAAPPVAAWLDKTLIPRLFADLQADGHQPGIYWNFIDGRDPKQGLKSEGFSPRFSQGYVAVRNRPSILVEAHMLKPYRTRVFTHYRILQHTLELIGRNPAPLREAIREADASTVKMGSTYEPSAKLPLSVKTTKDATPFLFKGVAYRTELSDISGAVRILYDATKPIEFDTVWYRTTQPDVMIDPPLAYIIPPQWTQAIDRATLHGLRAERLTEPATIEVQSYRFSDVRFAERPAEGRFAVRFKSERITATREFPPGSIIVPLNQPNARVAIHLFEPDAPDSLIRWGFFNTVFEQKEYAEGYTLEALARKMLEADPKLREQFETKVRTDREFAGNARARLNFFYERSPYWDQSLNVYPIGRVIKPISSRREPLLPT